MGIKRFFFFFESVFVVTKALSERVSGIFVQEPCRRESSE